MAVLCLSACGDRQGPVDGPIRFSPDGQSILLAIRHNGSSAIYSFPRQGGDGWRLTHDGDDSDPAWSPDGSKLVFVRTNRDGNGDIWMREEDSNKESRITETESNERLPIFSGDGTRLWFGRAGTLRTTSTFGTIWIDWSIVELNLISHTERQLSSVTFRTLSGLNSSRDGQRLLLSVGELRGVVSRIYELDVMAASLEAVGQPGDSSAAYLYDDHQLVVIRRIEPSRLLKK
jgi:dipeptidyl aminopeptidase/acylaminoacyl peptidase